MEPKSNKNLIKFRVDFYNDFEYLFFDLDSILAPKTYKMRGLGVTFSTSLRICEKCDFEQPSCGFTTFFDFRRVDFRLQKVYFSDVFSKMLSRRTFFRFWVEIGTKIVVKWEPTSIKKSMKI